MNERTEKDKLLSSKEEELKKLDGRLHNAQTDKNSLHAKLAAAEKELKEIKKANELLKNKVGAVLSSFSFIVSLVEDNC